MAGLTVKDLRIGSRLIMGEYGVTNYSLLPITWLKMTRSGDFISEFVLDELAYDAAERHPDRRYWISNADYQLSNIRTFLNSSDETWYHPTHERDAPPALVAARYGYEQHYGFLYGFGSHEIAAMQKVDGDRVRLPLQSEIIDPEPASLFKRKGIRAMATNDLDMRKLRSTCYRPYWLKDDAGPAFDGVVPTIGADAYVHHQGASQTCGVRPVCRLKLDAVVDHEWVAPYGNAFFLRAQDEIKSCTDADIFQLLGLV